MRAFKGWRLRHLILPNVGAVRRSLGSPVRDVLSGKQALHDATAGIFNAGAPCPSCGGHSLELSREGFEADGPHPLAGDAIFICRSCGYEATTETLVEAVPAELQDDDRDHRIARIRRTAGNLFAFGVIFVVAAASYAAYAGAWLTLAGGVLITSNVWLRAALLRYRAWQMQFRRLYEKKAPIADWIRWELSEPEL